MINYLYGDSYFGDICLGDICFTSGCLCFGGLYDGYFLSYNYNLSIGCLLTTWFSCINSNANDLSL